MIEAEVDDAVVVTGMGAASALGTGLEAHRVALWMGRHGFRTVTRFDTSQMSAHLAATWPAWDGREQPKPGPDADLATTAEPFPLHELALVAAREAWSNAGVVADPRRVALVFGTCFGQGFKDFHSVTERIAKGIDVAGPRITISTACASSTNAVGLARDLLLRGYADVVVAGGADALMREAFAGFSALGVLSAQPCAPFSEPPGTTLGEGAGFLVLERALDATRRGKKTWGSVCGYGLSADGFHETTPDPTGAGVARAIRAALEDAGWDPTSVDFVSAHATGTTNNDHVEWSVIARELGGGGSSPLVSGSKGHIGHTQGAAGALELILALICQSEGRVPPTLQFCGARAGCPSDPIAERKPRTLTVSRALKLSAAFGGANAVLAYGDGVISTRRCRPRPLPIAVKGVGVIGPRGAFRCPSVVELTQQRSVGPCASIDFYDLGIDPRRLDRSALWLTAAATLALKDERKRAPDRTGLFVAATRMPEQSARRCRESIERRGIAGTSAAAFARMSVNAPTGACSRALGLLGPTSTVSVGDGSGLLAIVLAAEWLAVRNGADCIVAGAVDELSGLLPDEAEGAVCIVLERARPGEGSVVLAQWGISGPDDAFGAARRAMAGRLAVDGLIVDGDASIVNLLREFVAPGTRLVDQASRTWGTSEATRSGVMTALGVAHLTARQAESILLVAARGTSTTALLLERRDP